MTITDALVINAVFETNVRIHGLDVAVEDNKRDPIFAAAYAEAREIILRHGLAWQTNNRGD